MGLSTQKGEDAILIDVHDIIEERSLSSSAGRI
jgi:hypothetical protein